VLTFGEVLQHKKVVAVRVVQENTKMKLDIEIILVKIVQLESTKITLVVMLALFVQPDNTKTTLGKHHANRAPLGPIVIMGGIRPHLVPLVQLAT
jgi:hypothetical protein